MDHSLELGLGRACTPFLSLPGVTVGYFYDMDLADSCVVSRDLVAELNLPSRMDRINLYDLREPVDLKLSHTWYAQIERKVKKIAVNPRKAGRHIWIRFQNNEELTRKCNYQMKIGSNIAIDSFSPFDIDLFRVHRKIFDCLFGNWGSFDRAIDLVRFKSSFTNVSEEVMSTMYNVLVKHKIRLQDHEDSYARKISMVAGSLAYLLYGTVLDKPITETGLRPVEIFEIFDILLIDGRYLALERLVTEKSYWNHMTEEMRNATRKKFETKLGVNYSFTSLLIENVFADEPFSNSVLLTTMEDMFQNHITLVHNSKLFFLLMDKYAEQVDFKVVEQGRKKISTILRKIFFLSAHSHPDVQGYFYCDFSLFYLHARRSWDFAFQGDDSCCDEIEIRNRSDIKFWIIELMGLEMVLMLQMDPDDFFDSLMGCLLCWKDLPVMLVLEALEFYLYFTRFLEKMAFGAVKKIEPIIDRILELLSFLFKSRLLGIPDKDGQVKTLCILSHIHCHRIFQIYLSSLDFGALVFRKPIDSKIVLARTIFTTDAHCFVRLLNEVPFTAQELKQVFNDARKGLPKLGSEKIFLMQCLIETYASFNSSLKSNTEIQPVIFWDIPETLLTIDGRQVETLIWCFRFFLLHFLKIPLGSSRIFFDTMGFEDIAPIEYEAFLNFFVDRVFELNGQKEKILIRVPKAVNYYSDTNPIIHA